MTFNLRSTVTRLPFPHGKINPSAHKLSAIGPHQASSENAPRGVRAKTLLHRNCRLHEASNFQLVSIGFTAGGTPGCVHPALPLFLSPSTGILGDSHTRICACRPLQGRSEGKQVWVFPPKSSQSASVERQSPCKPLTASLQFQRSGVPLGPLLSHCN